MREGSQPMMSFLGREPDRKTKGMHSSGSELDRKYWVALGLYAVLAVLVWLTMGEGKVSSWAGRWS